MPADRIEVKTATGSVFWAIDHFPFQRVHVHVVKCADEFSPAPNAFLACYKLEIRRLVGQIRSPRPVVFNSKSGTPGFQELRLRAEL